MLCMYCIPLDHLLTNPWPNIEFCTRALMCVLWFAHFPCFFSFTDSVGEKAFSLNAFKEDGSRARVHMQLLDRHDGSYIVRFKMHQTYTNMRIEIMYGNFHVAHSPYILQGKHSQNVCML